MKKTIIKFFDKSILLILGLSAISYSCYKYGMPVDEFEIYGTVTDKEKNPIKNIRVTDQLVGEIVYTDANGKFHYHFWESNRLEFEDIDGEANGGKFLPQKMNVKFTEADIIKKGKRNQPDKYAKQITVELEKDGVIPLYGIPTAPFKP